MFDVRAIANIVLDRADELDRPVSNMALNKIIYFVHCDYLIDKGEALVSAKIEAWQHGPVFREIYQEFKRWEDNPIRTRATRIDPTSGEFEFATITFGLEEKTYINSLIDRYIGFTAAQLRAISHREGGPWHRVWAHDGRSNPGMKISNELIRENYLSGARQ